MKRPSTTAAQRLRCFADHGAIVLCQAKGCDAAIYIRDAEIDHIQALVDGGTHEQSNFRPICFACNRRKGAFEHKRNSKRKRLAKAQELHRAVVARVTERPAGAIKSRGFAKGWRKRMNGKAERRT